MYAGGGCSDANNAATSLGSTVYDEADVSVRRPEMGIRFRCSEYCPSEVCGVDFFDVLRVFPTNSTWAIVGIIDEQIIEEKYNQRYDLKQ